MSDSEDAWRAISDAEEELRTQEAWEDYQPGDGIPEVFLTRIMERHMVTREEAGAMAQEWHGSPEGICYFAHAIAKRMGRAVPPHGPCYHPDV